MTAAFQCELKIVIYINRREHAKCFAFIHCPVRFLTVVAKISARETRRMHILSISIKDGNSVAGGAGAV